MVAGIDLPAGLPGAAHHPAELRGRARQCAHLPGHLRLPAPERLVVDPDAAGKRRLAEQVHVCPDRDDWPRDARVADLQLKRLGLQ